MEQEISTPPSMPLPSAKSKPDRGPRRGAMPLPGEPKSQGRKTSDDRKAPVEPPVEDEEIKVPQMKKKVGVPVFPVSNGVKEPAQHSPAQQSPRQGRSLPPPPAVTPERREPEKPHAAKSTTPQKAELTESDLLRQKWYHGNIKRIDAEIKLKQLSIDGMYLIRKSSQGSDQPYTLQIFFHGKCYNLPIRRRSDNLLAVGKEEKEGEKAFSSLLDLVNMFKQNILVLSGGAETKLVKSLPKS
ncbi:SH2 domain-containing protein 6-like isoform X2 [Ruditapes philippinarum]|uniref:SH2 domain-containing protein 6-like isoform X2 n=1 Tax=Ruditapes philippinarum TaxID=129788 RepID=UPI00295B1FE1|nr:SH2 domain-containing protein 6-like isoform X2 [Ruditapes philippinarum]